MLVIGASGGVGSYAVQLAKALGAEVTGVSSAAKLDLVRSLGADHVLDYTRDDFADGDAAYDLILDIGGNPSLSRLRRALTPTGTAVHRRRRGGRQPGRAASAGAAGPVASLFMRQRLAMLASKERASRPRAARRAPRGRHGEAELDRTYPLDEVPDAMRHLIDGNVRGKVAITIPTEEGSS